MIGDTSRPSFRISPLRHKLIPLPIFLVASNAAVGGPSTAATFAESVRWIELVLPAAVCGTLGYALGTPVAVVAELSRAGGAGGAGESATSG